MIGALKRSIKSMAGISAHRSIMETVTGEKWRRRSASKRAKNLCIVRKRKLHRKGVFIGKVCKMPGIACAVPAAMLI